MAKKEAKRCDSISMAFLMPPMGLRSQRSPYFQKLEEDIQILMYLPHLGLLQQFGDFSFCDGCTMCMANLCSPLRIRVKVIFIFLPETLFCKSNYSLFGFFVQNLCHKSTCKIYFCKVFVIFANLNVCKRIKENCS